MNKTLTETPRILEAGAPLGAAKAVAILLHGRGGQASDMLNLARHLAPSDVAFLLPQAAGNTWYPQRFLAPIEQNEPFLSAALLTVAKQVERCREAGIRTDQIIVGGFSQGACLALEFVARNPNRFGAVLAFSGALIGPLEQPREDKGDLTHTPIFIGCSDTDFHIPLDAVHASARILKSLGAKVDERIYKGMGHEICEDEIVAARALIEAIVKRS